MTILVKEGALVDQLHKMYDQIPDDITSVDIELAYHHTIQAQKDEIYSVISDLESEVSFKQAVVLFEQNYRTNFEETAFVLNMERIMLLKYGTDRKIEKPFTGPEFVNNTLMEYAQDKLEQRI